MKLTDNTLKYLKEYGGLSFGERPFSHVDSLILCQLSYFKFQDLVPDLVEKMDGNDIRGVTMRSLRKHPKYNSLYVSDWYEKDNRRLYAAVARSRRFAKMRLNYYTNLTDKEMQMQFSAVTFLLEDGTVYVAFRGTDETIVGWREDFDMALKSPIPSPTAARLYLRHIAEYTGFSKPTISRYPNTMPLRNWGRVLGELEIMYLFLMLLHLKTSGRDVVHGFKRLSGFLQKT